MARVIPSQLLEKCASSVFEVQILKASKRLFKSYIEKYLKSYQIFKIQ